MLLATLLPKRRKEKKATLLPRERERESNLKKTLAFLSIKKKFIPNQFFLNFGEKTFWWARGDKNT